MTLALTDPHNQAAQQELCKKLQTGESTFLKLLPLTTGQYINN